MFNSTRETNKAALWSIYLTLFTEKSNCFTDQWETKCTKTNEYLTKMFDVTGALANMNLTSIPLKTATTKHIQLLRGKYPILQKNKICFSAHHFPYR